MSARMVLHAALGEVLSGPELSGGNVDTTTDPHACWSDDETFPA